MGFGGKTLGPDVGQGDGGGGAVSCFLFRRPRQAGTQHPCVIHGRASALTSRTPQFPFPLRPSRYKLRSMLKTLIFCLKLAIVFGGIVLFGRAIQYLIFNGGFSGEFYDYLFMRK